VEDLEFPEDKRLLSQNFLIWKKSQLSCKQPFLNKGNVERYRGDFNHVFQDKYSEKMGYFSACSPTRFVSVGVFPARKC